jgi:hypothetical protein
MERFDEKYDLLKKLIAEDKIDEKHAKNSLNWYFRKVSELNFKHVTPKELIEHQKTVRNQLWYGHMYHFLYLPKYREELPYYDKFPLVFPVQRVDGGFLGLNLHYINPKERMNLMKQLYKYQTNDTTDAKTKLVLTYRLLNKTKSLQSFKPCLKRYLYSHIRSNFLKIEYSEWNIILFLPTEQFEKESKYKVWKESKGK